METHNQEIGQKHEMKSQSVIRVKNLNYSYPGSEKPALKDVNMEVRRGELLFVSGPNGGGKTTLCKCFNGLIPHSTGGELTGTVKVCGLNTRSATIQELSRHVGFVFQNAEDQIVTLKVLSELSFGLENLGLPRGVIDRNVAESIYKVGLEGLEERFIYNLSTGQMQLVALASILAMKPEILVLDDPLSHVNRRLAKRILDVILDLKRSGMTIIFVGNSVEELYDHIDRIVIIDGGSIRFNGPIESLAQSPEVLNLTTVFPQFVELSHWLIRDGFMLNTILKTIDDAVDEYRAALSRSARREKILKTRELAVSAEKAVQIDGVTFRYPSGFLALKKVNLEIDRGDFILLTGENGSGKTTLMKHLNGLLRPSEGRVILDGLDISKTPTSELARKVGFLFQNPDHQLNKPTVREELAFSLRCFGFDDGEIKGLVADISERLEVGHLLDRPPQWLSSSEKKRITVASILVYEPEIMILDEPTANLDRRETERMMKAIEDFHSGDKITIVVSHDVKLWPESKYINRVIVMKEGMIMKDGTPEEVFTNDSIMDYLNLGLLPVTKISRELSEFGVRPDVYSIRGMREEISDITRS